MADGIDDCGAGVLRDLIEPLVGAVLDLTFKSGDELRTRGDPDVVRNDPEVIEAYLGSS